MSLYDFSNPYKLIKCILSKLLRERQKCIFIKAKQVCFPQIILCSHYGDTRSFLGYSTDKAHREPCTHITVQMSAYRLVLSWSAPQVSSVSVCPPRRPGFLCGAPASRRRGRSLALRDPWKTPLAWVERQSQSGRSRPSSPYCFHCPVRRQQIREGRSKRDCQPFVCDW